MNESESVNEQCAFCIVSKIARCCSKMANFSYPTVRCVAWGNQNYCL